MSNEFRLVDALGYFGRILVLVFSMCTLDGAIHMYAFTQYITARDHMLAGSVLILQTILSTSQLCLTMYVLVKVGVEEQNYLLYAVVMLQYIFSLSVCNDYIQDRESTRLLTHVDVTTPLNKEKVRQYHCENLHSHVLSKPILNV